jgi:transposase
MDRTLYALDLAKQVFQVAWVDEKMHWHDKRLSRSQVMGFFARLAPAKVAMEACASAHHFGRALQALGHEVTLVHARYVRPFVKTNKTDQADARAIWTAASQPEMRPVPVKSVQQQAQLALHRLRESRVRMRTALTNQLRGLLGEFGVVLKAGRNHALIDFRARLAQLEALLPGAMLEELCVQGEWIERLDAHIAALERRLIALHRPDARFRELDRVPGIGRLTASCLLATMGSAGQFGSGRQASACVGVVPRQSGTGGKVHLGPISKRGDRYLRTLLIHGARSVIAHGKTHSPWLAALIARRGKNVAAVALANKNMRIAWALITRGTPYRPQAQAGEAALAGPMGSV